VLYRREILLASLTIVAAFAVGGAALWLSRTRPPNFRVVMRGTRSTGGDLGVSGGNIVAVAGRSGILFGTVKRPGTPERLTYVILFEPSSRC